MTLRHPVLYYYLYASIRVYVYTWIYIHEQILHIGAYTYIYMYDTIYVRVCVCACVWMSVAPRDLARFSSSTVAFSSASRASICWKEEGKREGGER